MAFGLLPIAREGLRPVLFTAASRWVVPGKAKNMCWIGGWMFMVASCCWPDFFFCVFALLFSYTSGVAGGDGVNAVDAMQNVLIL